jgi:hypothetical protein
MPDLVIPTQELHLPIYEPETDIYTKRDLHEGRAISGDSFVREVSIRAVGFSSIQDALDATDIELRAVADMTGSRVVDHQWGLYRLPEDHPSNRLPEGQWPSNTILHPPQGFWLVAEVATVHGARKLRRKSKRYKELDAITSDYEYDRRVGGLPRLTDMNASQFLKGRTNGSRGLTLGDIEPRVQQ